MKFLIDMPLSPELADWLNRQGHDAHHALVAEFAADAFPLNQSEVIEEIINEIAGLEKE